MSGDKTTNHSNGDEKGLGGFFIGVVLTRPPEWMQSLASALPRQEIAPDRLPAPPQTCIDRSSPVMRLWKCG